MGKKYEINHHDLETMGANVFCVYSPPIHPQGRSTESYKTLGRLLEAVQSTTPSWQGNNLIGRTYLTIQFVGRLLG